MVSWGFSSGANSGGGSPWPAASLCEGVLREPITLEFRSYQDADLIVAIFQCRVFREIGKRCDGFIFHAIRQCASPQFQEGEELPAEGKSMTRNGVDCFAPEA